ncbi:SPOR domain-containing protein [Marinilabilia rubra]|uniref:Sporulation protein n=1 Tax=Marinilabilia rubra TaxID=2162893 RepID=A0A2U2BEF9_9BACT|nr:SPOR domain-containing protein [Marinilabilia rubra]PWE01449.1 sporulation protein [Marinilabilia rubra]
MEQYLLELIKHNNRVIVPNFGAFIVSRDAGTTVLFNNFLSFNDGLLINHVSKEEGIDTTEATEKVSNFVDSIKKELDEKGEYILDKLGSFTKDQNGILRFTQDPDLTELLPEEEEPSEQTAESSLLDIDNDAPEDKGEKEEKKEKPTGTKKPAGEKRKIKDESLLNLDEDKETDKENKKEEAKAAAPPVPPPTKPEAATTKNKPPKEPVYDERKKFVLPPWAIALIIIIPVTLILLYLLVWRDNDKATVPIAKKVEVVDTVKKKPAVDSAALKKAEEERQRKEQEAKEALERAEAEKAKRGKHQVIVGSFKNQQNAEKLVSELKSKGFKNASHFTHNNLHMVSAASFESLPEARNAQEKILQEQKLENWILTKK